MTRNVYMTEADLRALPSRSWGLPTGATLGRRWRKPVGIGWWLGCFYDGPDVPEGQVGIAWFRIHIVILKCARSRWLDTWNGQGDPARSVYA